MLAFKAERSQWPVANHEEVCSEILGRLAIEASNFHDGGAPRGNKELCLASVVVPADDKRSPTSMRSQL